MSGQIDKKAPAVVFHASVTVADEAIARGWSIWDFVERIGTLDAPFDVLCWQLYSVRDPHMHMGEDGPIDLERVFGISASYWHRVEALCRQYPDRIAEHEPYVLDWYETA